MKFDIDRFAKLAGLRTTETVKDAAPASSPAVLRESVQRLEESAEIKQLRQIIRNETRSILEAARVSKTKSVDTLVESAQRSKSLTEAMATLGFLGPGFGGNKAIMLGAPMTSASRFASLHEEDESSVAEEEKDGPDEVDSETGVVETDDE